MSAEPRLAGRAGNILPALSIAVVWLAIGVVAAQQNPQPTFRSGVSQVMLNVVVKDTRGRPVIGLSAGDFQVFDDGQAVSLSDFRAQEQPISLALLFDTSGSMRIADRLNTANQAVGILLAHLHDRLDEAGLFTFDSTLREMAPFSSDIAHLQPNIDSVNAYGSTSLHDAIAAAARRSVDRPLSRRAVVAITDGVDTSSQLSAKAASRMASAIDVPVYVLAVGSDPPQPGPSEDSPQVPTDGLTARLDDLTRWTGGAVLSATTPAQMSVSARQIVSDLRTGYGMAFAPRNVPGWHQVTVRVARSGAMVRTRAGFWIGASDPASR